jgi:ABC-type sugar transport system ATPase subunit
MSDRILVMRDGRIVAEFDRADATQPLIAHAMMASEEASANETVAAGG